jgi:hypothetical protein
LQPTDINQKTIKNNGLTGTIGFAVAPMLDWFY